jgi:hypothetical protein
MSDDLTPRRPRTSAAVKNRYAKKTYGNVGVRIRKDSPLWAAMEAYQGSKNGLIIQLLTRFFGLADGPEDA